MKLRALLAVSAAVAALAVPGLASADNFSGPGGAAKLIAYVEAHRTPLNQGTPHLNVSVAPNAGSNIHFDAINKMGGTAYVRPNTQTTFTAPKAILDMNFGKGTPSGYAPPGVTVTRTSATTVVVTARPTTSPVAARPMTPPRVSSASPWRR